MFSRKKADWAIEFIARLKHTKGEWAGKPFQLQKWQKMFLKELFGRVKGDGLRQYQTAYLEIPRKNGKSELAAAIALFLLFGDNEPGAEIYSAAADREQASLVFNAQRRWSVTVLSDMCKIMTLRTDRIYETASFTGHQLGGVQQAWFNAHAVIYDEIHSAPNRELWDVLSTSMGARTQPLMLGITTAGYDRNSICWELHDYGQKIIDGVVEDPTFFPLIFAADEGDEWTDEKVWRKANPNLGVSIKLDFLRRECNAPRSRVPGTFRRLYLNHGRRKTRWLDMENGECGADSTRNTSPSCAAGPEWT